MPYRIEYTQTALRSLRDVPAYFRALAKQEIAGLPLDPRPAKAQELRDRPDRYRIWLRQWRLIYRVFEERKVVRVLDVRLKTGPETYEDLEDDD